MTEDGLRAPRDKTARAAVDFAVRYGMRGRGTLVAFSGGCDSTALLWITARLSGGYFGPVAAMHVNHGIRGDEAERDEKHCRDFCAEHGIPFYSERVDIPAIAKRCGGGIEETARAERYRLLAARAAALGYDRVATAHHADDNLETVIFRLLRGSALRGLGGIPPVREITPGSDILLVRPLLGCTREQLETLCRDRKLDYVTDGTNCDTAYARNLIRSVLPRLTERINPSAATASVRMCESLREDEELLERLSESGETPPSLPGARPLLTRRLRRDHAAAGGDALDAEHLRELADLALDDRRLWSRVSLPGSVEAVRTRDGVDFCAKEKSKDDKRDKFGDFPLAPGLNILPGERGAIYLGMTGDEGICAENTKAGINIYKLFIQNIDPSVKLEDDFLVRERRPGDTIRRHGVTKSVKKLLCELKIPPSDRERLLFVCRGKDIIWIPTAAVADGYRAENGVLTEKPQTKKA